MSDGYNPMGYNCQKSGCFNQMRRPKIERFADCFPGKISYGDVDGIVEMGGAFNMLEWKGDGGHLKRAQQILLEQMTRLDPRNVAFVVHGNAKTMEVDGYTLYRLGKPEPFQRANFEEVHNRIAGWAKWVQGLRCASSR